MTLTTPPNLGNVITNGAIRKVIYAVFVVLGFILGATQVGFAATEGAGQPQWLTIALAVYAFASIPIGSLALSNTPATGEVVAVAYAEERDLDIDRRGEGHGDGGGFSGPIN